MSWKVSYDAKADALYVRFRDFDPALGVTTISAEGKDVAVDVQDRELVGIEVLGAASHPIFGYLVPKGIKRYEATGATT